MDIRSELLYLLDKYDTAGLSKSEFKRMERLENMISEPMEYPTEMGG